MYGTYDTEMIYFMEYDWFCGTIHDVAHAFKNGFQQGFDVEDYVIIFNEDHEVVKLPIKHKFGKYDDHDYARHTLSIIFPAREIDHVMEDYELEVSYSVDGRA